MTKEERKAVQGQFNTMIDLENRQDEIFKRLQNLNEKIGTGTRWCSASDNVKDLLKCGEDYMELYREYSKLSGQIEMMRKFGSALAEVGFWK